MSGYSPASIAEAAKRIIAERHAFSVKVIGAETRCFPAGLGETVAMALTLLARDNTNRALVIIDDPPADIGPELFDGVPAGSDMIISAEKPICVQPNDRAVGRFEYGSSINLPRASSSLDAVAWVFGELELDIASFTLRELFRVLKPGGQLVLAATSKSTGLDLRRSLLAAQIAFDEDEMPSAPVYSGSLRKTAPQAVGLPPRSRSAAAVRGVEPVPARSDAPDPRLAVIEEENARQVDLVGKTATERQGVIDEEHIVIEGAVRRAFGEDGWIWVSDDFADSYPGKFFLTGWRSPLEWVIWSRESKCVLMLPYPAERSPARPRLELQLQGQRVKPQGDRDSRRRRTDREFPLIEK